MLLTATHTSVFPKVPALTFEEKVEYFYSDMKAKGELPSNVNPPFVKILWMLGRKIPPLIFLPFGQAALVCGSVFLLGMMVGWLVILSVSTWIYPLIRGVVISDARLMLLMALLFLGGGVLFSVTIAFSLRRKRRALQFTELGNYPSTENNPPL